jgi:hypothetical protein
MPLSPRDFAFVTPPSPQQWQGPQIDFSLLGNLAKSYYQGQMAPLDLKAKQVELQKNLYELGYYQKYANQPVPPAWAGLGAVPSSTGTTGTTGGTVTDDTRSGGPVLASLQNAMFGQESDYGRNRLAMSGEPNSKGAIGPGQMLPATFAANAQPGENIRDPIDNSNVANRTLAKYFNQYNGDWSRAAVAYFSGEGNVAPPGSPTPFRRNTNDGNITVAQYVQDIGARMRSGGPPVRMASGGGSGTSQPAPNEEYPGASAGGPPFARTANTGPAASPSASGPQTIRLASADGNLSGMLGNNMLGNRPASTIVPTSSVEVAGTQGQGIGSPTNPPASPITPSGRDNLAQAGSPPQPMQTAQATMPQSPDQDNRIKFMDDQLRQGGNYAAWLKASPYAPDRAKGEAIEADLTRLQGRRNLLYDTLNMQYQRQLGTTEEYIRNEQQAKTQTEAEDIRGARSDARAYIAQKRKEASAAGDELTNLGNLGDAIHQAGPNLTPGDIGGIAAGLKQHLVNLGLLDPAMAPGLAPEAVIRKYNELLMAKNNRELGGQGLFFTPRASLMETIEGTKDLMFIEQQIRRNKIGLINELEDRYDTNRDVTARHLGRIESEYYDKHPIISPYTRKPITGQEAPPSSGLNQNAGFPEPHPDDIRDLRENPSRFRKAFEKAYGPADRWLFSPEEEK